MDKNPQGDGGVKEKLMHYLCKSCQEGVEAEKIPLLQSPGSVASAAYHIALHIGFRHIAFHGLDFASPFFDSHIYCGAHFSYFYQASNRVNPLPSQDFKLIKPRLREQKEKSPSGSFFYKEIGLYEYGRTLEHFLLKEAKKVKKAKHFSSGVWGLKLKNVLTMSEWRPLPVSEKKSVLKPHQSTFLKFETQKYIYFTQVKKTVAQCLQALEQKDLQGFKKEQKKLNGYLNEMDFLKAALQELTFHLRRREGENPYGGHYQLYRELYKFMYVIEHKVLGESHVD